MSKEYKRLGNYIRDVSVLNKDLSVDLLLGVSIEKKFIPSIANTVGTDFSSYKIVEKGQFAYGPVTSRNGDKISIALLSDYKKCIISSSYTVFEIIKPEQLLDEYLLLLFKSPEFDRYSRYNSWGSARETFSWEDFCDSELYIPDISIQKKIVDDYNTIQKRKQMISSIDEKLMDIAKVAIKKHIVEYEESEKVPLSDYCTDIKAGGTPSRTNSSFWNSNDYMWIKNGEVKNNIILESEEYISEEGLKKSSAKLIEKGSVLMAMYCVSTPQLSINEEELTTNQAVCALTCHSKKEAIYLYYYLMFNGYELMDDANGTAQQNLSKEKIERFEIIKPTEKCLDSLYQIYLQYLSNSKEMLILNKIEKELLKI